MQPIEERALGDISGKILNAGVGGQQVKMTLASGVNKNQETSQQLENKDVGTEPTITVQMHDHDSANNCSCMEENKESQIQTIFSYKADQGAGN